MTLLPPPAEALVPQWQWFIATWFGAGLVEPLRAGLAIAIAAIIVLPLSKTVRFAVPFFGFVILVIGVYLTSTIGDASGVNDDRRIVIDEVAAFVLGVTFLHGRHWFARVAFAGLFLLIDRIKPWPFYYLENLPSGYGVMTDDLGPALLLGLVFYFALSLWDKARNA